MAHSFVALYSGDSYLDSDLVAVSSDPEVVDSFMRAVRERIADDELPDEPYRPEQNGHGPGGSEGARSTGQGFVP